jgi:uncharacterized protein DUF4129
VIDRRRALLGLAALVLLLAAVAIASAGSLPAGAGGARRPADQFVDVLISLYLVLMVVGAATWVYVLAVSRDGVAEAIVARKRRSRWRSFLKLTLGFLLLGLVLRWLAVDGDLRNRIAAQVGRGQRSPSNATRSPDAYQPHFATWPVVIVLALVAIGVVAWYVSYRARRRRLEPFSDRIGPALADLLEETLDDLRAEADARKAVIAAYARMERALAAYGLPRDPSEAPEEYLGRILADLEVSRRSIARLTALFAWAKFSGHDVAPEMKDEAIAALEAVRAELRAAEILAEARRLEMQRQLHERAGS